MSHMDDFGLMIAGTRIVTNRDHHMKVASHGPQYNSGQNHHLGS